MVTKHLGTGIAQVPQPIDPDETRWVWFSWASAPISSEWELEGATPGDVQTDQQVTGDDGQIYKHCNGIRITPNSGASNILVTNRCVFSNGETLARTVQLKVRML